MYFDSNSIVYDALRFLSKDYEKYKNDDEFEKRTNKVGLYKYRKLYFGYKTQQEGIVAFDGVAPVAKLEQQRTRRHKSMFEKRVLNHISGEKK